ncbi:hypothetical protein BDN71DRAFT_1509008 [Pleurotus eryngii]|uniref:Uncharacterized protein n=1 Tax=Pleurotus eryngii TaxID=5323 RepID=A0A9P5ZTJ0_PLEER|nr:hypothetical protein BDN71DRAFT_1509008 [Pleurotus eryngii]
MAPRGHHLKTWWTVRCSTPAAVITPAPIIAPAAVITPAPVVTPTPVITPTSAVTLSVVAPAPVPTWSEQVVTMKIQTW